MGRRSATRHDSTRPSSMMIGSDMLDAPKICLYQAIGRERR